MKKLKNNKGMTLIEMMLALLIMVIMVVAMGNSMAGGFRIYSEATFEADTSSLSGILNNSLGDVLRYSENVRENTSGFKDSNGVTHFADSIPFVFTSYDYGIRDAFFADPAETNVNNDKTVLMKNLHDDSLMHLINTGAYPNLMISAFDIQFTPYDSTTKEGGYFEIQYTIADRKDESRTRSVDYVIRQMNIPA